MKSLSQLHITALLDVGQFCAIDITLDVANIKKRCEDEGDEYLTIVLPRFAKALERGLDKGVWPAHDVSPTWKHIKGLPVFMRGFLSRIFDPVSGVLVESPDTDCIWAVRQVCYLTHKIERDCSPARERQAFAQFVSTDDSLRGLPGRLDQSRLNEFKRVSRKLFGRVFQECDRKIASWELVPKHGPGAVAESLSQSEKRQYHYWTERLEEVFPSWRYTANTPRGIKTELVPMSEELPVRVISVPKTQSTPRIIAIEPSSVQYAQQGLKRELYELIGRGSLGRILGFQDQTRNQHMAQKASVDSSLATLDLSEASDRIHWFLVKAMTEDFPHLWDFLWRTRSHRADVSGWGIIPLQKFASMGSALTFPLEAMVFTTLSWIGVEQAHSRKYNVNHLVGRVSVYGDDIIVPIDAIDHVVDWLEHFGALVNRSKSFWTGRFRESCGSEFYAGIDVSVVRLRSELPSSRDDAAEIANLLDFRNRAYRAGLWVLVRDLDNELEELMRIPYYRLTPEVSPPFLARESVLAPSFRRLRYDPKLQRWEHPVPVLVPQGVSYTLDDEAGLLEWFHDALRRGDLVDRYDSKERATSFHIKRRWVCVTL